MPPMYDYLCEKCQHHEDRMIRYEDRDSTFTCPNCEGDMERVWIKAPSTNSLGAEGSDASVNAMKQSFKERFKKKEQDDVRHKYGRLYDDARLSAAAQKIKKATEDK